MLPFNERAKAVFAALDTTPHKFANQHGFNRASIFNLVNPLRKPGLELLERVCGVEPRISAEYLLRAEGEPLRDVRLSTALTTVEQLRDFQSEMNQSIDLRVKALQEGN